MFDKLTYLPTRVRSLLTYNAATPVFFPPNCPTDVCCECCGTSMRPLASSTVAQRTQDGERAVVTDADELVDERESELRRGGGGRRASDAVRRVSGAHVGAVARRPGSCCATAVH